MNPYTTSVSYNKLLDAWLGYGSGSLSEVLESISVGEHPNPNNYHSYPTPRSIRSKESAPTGYEDIVVKVNRGFDFIL